MNNISGIADELTHKRLITVYSWAGEVDSGYNTLLKENEGNFRMRKNILDAYDNFKRVLREEEPFINSSGFGIPISSHPAAQGLTADYRRVLKDVEAMRLDTKAKPAESSLADNKIFAAIDAATEPPISSVPISLSGWIIMGTAATLGLLIAVARKVYG